MGGARVATPEEVGEQVLHVVGKRSDLFIFAISSALPDRLLAEAGGVANGACVRVGVRLSLAALEGPEVATVRQLLG